MKVAVFFLFIKIYLVPLSAAADSTCTSEAITYSIQAKYAYNASPPISFSILPKDGPNKTQLEKLRAAGFFRRDADIIFTYNSNTVLPIADGIYTERIVVEKISDKAARLTGLHHRDSLLFHCNIDPHNESNDSSPSGIQKPGGSSI
jgi:hypothetical protein